MNLDASVTGVKIRQIIRRLVVSPCELEDDATSLLFHVDDFLRAFQVDNVVTADFNFKLMQERNTLAHRVQCKDDVED